MSSMRSTPGSDDERGRASVSLYKAAPPMTNACWRFVFDSSRRASADFRLSFKTTAEFCGTPLQKKNETTLFYREGKELTAHNLNSD